MKTILILFFFTFCKEGISQVVFADPSLGQMILATTNNANLSISTTASLPQSTTYILKVPIKNLAPIGAIPVGCAKVKIGLGSKLILDQNYPLSNTNTSSVFSWTAEVSGGQVQITGELKVPLVAQYEDTSIFYVQGTILGNSTITGNFLVSNNNPIIVLSDDDGANNISSLPYIITTAVPVKFIGIWPSSTADCNYKIEFKTANEVNLKHYEIQYSLDGIRFEVSGIVMPNISNTYQYIFPAFTSIHNTIFIRVKSVDYDGSSDYSEVKSATNRCIAKGNIQLYPNPITTHNNWLNIKSTLTPFNGKYNINVFNSEGKLVISAEKNVTIQSIISMDVNNFAKGIYYLQLLESKSKKPIFSTSFNKL